MKKTIIVISILLVSMLTGCGNASATSGQTAPKPEEKITTNEAPAAATQEIAEEPQNNESSTTVTASEETTPKTKNVDWQDYVEDGVFNMDNYAEALGYTVIKADKSNSWYIFDTINYHYCIVAYRDTLNIMFDSYDVGYAINVIDRRSNAKVAEQCIQSDECSVSTQWLQESASLLSYIATNGPSEKEIQDFSGIETLTLSCVKWSECYVTDERGVIIDNKGTMETIWDKNWHKD